MAAVGLETDDMHRAGKAKEKIICVEKETEEKGIFLWAFWQRGLPEKYRACHPFHLECWQNNTDLVKNTHMVTIYSKQHHCQGTMMSSTILSCTQYLSVLNASAYYAFCILMCQASSLLFPWHLYYAAYLQTKMVTIKSCGSVEPDSDNHSILLFYWSRLWWCNFGSVKMWEFWAMQP